MACAPSITLLRQTGPAPAGRCSYRARLCAGGGDPLIPPPCRASHGRVHAAPDRREVEECRDVEADVRYRRVDYSELHSYEARQAFLRVIARGEAAIDLAEAALHIAAEDDATVSHSTVQLPVASYQQRLQRMAADLARQYLPAVQQAAPGDNEAVLQAIQQYLYKEQRFTYPGYGRTNLPERSVVDHPGVWESASHAYLNEALVSRRGIPAILAIILQDLVRRLLLLGAIDFAVRVDCRGMATLPTAEVLPLSRAMVVQGDGTVLNTCSSEALIEVLRFLKRCYWPFAWDSTVGGFRAAASVFLEGEEDAAMQAISRVAKHRLDRGIWTSPGGGDLRRALAACERLVLLCGDACPIERRDLAALYMHVGRFREAKTELLHFARSPLPPPSAAGAAAAPSLPVAFSLTPTGALVAGGGQALQEQQLTDRLLQLLSGVEAAAAPLTLAAALLEPPPQQQDDSSPKLPLTW